MPKRAIVVAYLSAATIFIYGWLIAAAVEKRAPRWYEYGMAIFTLTGLAIDPHGFSSNVNRIVVGVFIKKTRSEGDQQNETSEM